MSFYHHLAFVIYKYCDHKVQEIRRAITENGIAKEVQEPTGNVRINKSTTTKPQSVKSKPTQSKIVKLKQKQLKEKAITSIQSSPQPGPSHVYVSEDSELTDTDDETISEAEKWGSSR